MEMGVLGPINSLGVSQEEQVLRESPPKPNLGLQANRLIPDPILDKPGEQSQS